MWSTTATAVTTKSQSTQQSREEKLLCAVEIQGTIPQRCKIVSTVCSFQRETSLTPVHFISPILRQSTVTLTQATVCSKVSNLDYLDISIGSFLDHSSIFKEKHRLSIRIVEILCNTNLALHRQKYPQQGFSVQYGVVTLLREFSNYGIFKWLVKVFFYEFWNY